MPHNPAASAGAQRMVACHRCEHLNPVDSHRCSLCGDHLYVTCRFCGHKNERARSRCTECSHRLHRSLWRKLRQKLLPKNSKVKPWEVVLLVVAVYVTNKIVVKLAEMSF